MHVKPLYYIVLIAGLSVCFAPAGHGALCVASAAAVLLILEICVWLGGRRGFGSAALRGAASYRLYAASRLWANIAMGLAILACSGRWGLWGDAPFEIRTLRLCLISFCGCLLVVNLLPRALYRRVITRNLGGFFAGALLWTAAVVVMFCAEGAAWRVAGSAALAYSVSLMNNVVSGLRPDFAYVSRLAGGKGDSELKAVDRESVSKAGVIVSALMLVGIVLRALVPGFHEAVRERADVFFLLLSVCAMLVSVHFALRLPFYPRNREKLRLYADVRYTDGAKVGSLREMYVDKYRTLFGIKILCAAARPFFHLRVTGREKLRDENLPAVFVCNHGFIYGPISAILYLPTFFRPWIHDVMLNPETALREMMFSFSWMRRLFGEKLGRRMIRGLHGLVHWAITSFDPIPVVRGASRDVMSTFSLSLDALGRGDNILIFPERPNVRDGKGNLVNDAGRLRNLYTGFAHIGKMYYDKTGQPLVFYPVYAGRKAGRFFIGEPVRYNPGIDPRDAKKAVAEELQTRMAAMAEWTPDRRRRS